MIRITLFVVTLMLWGLPPSSRAQEQPQAMLDVRVVTVKPNRAAEWEVLQKEMNAALEASGAAGRDFWQVLIGDLDTYYIFREIEELGADTAVMEPTELARWRERVDDCVDSRRNMVLRQVGTVPVVEGKEYRLAMLRIRAAVPGRSHDLEEWYLDRFFPALREAGDEARFFSRVFLGGSTDTWYEFRLFEDWDAVNAPDPLEGGGPEIGRMFMDFEAMLTLASQDLLVHRADLSAE